jgi:hypothetical protein
MRSVISSVTVSVIGAAAAHLRNFRRRSRRVLRDSASVEGHLDGDDEMPHAVQVRLLRDGIPFHAQRLGAHLVVFKEFPAKYRGVLGSLLEDGYTRVPSYPMTRLDIGYPSFEPYMPAAQPTIRVRAVRNRGHSCRSVASAGRAPVTPAQRSWSSTKNGATARTSPAPSRRAKYR